MKSFSCFAYVAVSILLILGGCSHSSYLECSGNSEEDLMEEEKEIESDDETAKEEMSEEQVSSELQTIFVQAAGAVRVPGVYELPQDARVFEVIEKAGGLAKNADDSSLNQAQKLTDGQKIYVYRKDEIQKQPSDSGTSQTVVFNEIPDNTTDGLVNINTADAAQLMTLSGIGESKANAILSFRQENGGFQSIDDLKMVSGIGEATFEKLKEHITI